MKILIKMLKTLLPSFLRDNFRPIYRYWCTKLINSKEAVFGIKQQWKESLKRFLSLSTNEELYEFSKKEFGIIQNKIEIIGFLEYLKQKTPKIIVEIGTKYGGNSFLFIASLRKIDTYIGIDALIHNYGKLKYLVGNNTKIFSIQCYSQYPECKYVLRKLLKCRPIDLLFIDGDHSYEGVKSDFENYSPLVREGGLVAFHDIEPDKITNDCYGIGEVHRFWQEIKCNYDYIEFVEDYDQSGYGIGVIIKSY